MNVIIQAIVTGLLLGGLYALVGVGMSMIFGVMKLTNLAHGDFMILSSFIIVVFLQHVTNNMFVALILTIIVMLFFGTIVQKFLINRVIDKGADSPLLVMFGLSVIIQNALFLIFGPNAQIINTELMRTNIVSTQMLSVSALHLVNFLVAVAIIVALTVIMNKSSLGRAIRASSSNIKAAELMGINTKRMYIYAMGLTIIVTCVAGLLVGSTFMYFNFTGTQYLIIAFGVVVIGGMGSLMGTLIGGMILGLSQLLGATFFGTPYQTLSGFLVLLIILSIRPQGLFSKAIRK
ncbi:MAG: branched-chain amino acid ABC transporter permease [Oscillospiraceae bacterium]|nr:branched-chain amino acid ABC transporter permease [Oscillospiraceae bacterium]